MSPRVIVLSLLAFFVTAQSLPACSVPVFRYALERWAPDLFEVSVFFRGTLNEADEQRLTQLEDWAVHNGGQVNLEVVRCNLDEQVPADLLALLKSLKDAPLPAVVVRTPRKVAGQSIVWHGRLSDPFLDALAMSPTRREITQRLLQGDAVVWLLLRGTDEEQAGRTKKMLDAALEKLADEIDLPPGVGRPGSELLTKIPLHLKFSVVEVSADSHEEQALIKLLRSGVVKPSAASDSLIAPIFGRGRVLDVLSAHDGDAETITDLTRYLCSACSCQVKQQNPGFDLLCEINWDEQLFDATFVPSQLPIVHSSDAANKSTSDSEPTLVTIPSGHVTHRPQTLPAKSASTPSGVHDSFLLVLAVLAVAASLFVFAKSTKANEDP